eukprot:NODE_1177_length_1046_cov_81.519559_g811_i1.p4 GENE.NODE_1177_length_1046_cov_81.519559_g811_i1~~NODE_1177_length_1046_cov_81.519559_g811_i1.p4  ORF type:complete len:58 (-),score=13.89 NODE_1177_length_1046_cov_81.519559_g811_i1:3-176(-)
MGKNRKEMTLQVHTRETQNQNVKITVLPFTKKIYCNIHALPINPSRKKKKKKKKTLR